MKTITKSGLSGARACLLRGRRDLVLHDYKPLPSQPALAVYRGKTSFCNSVNRLLARGSNMAERAVPAMWADAWVRAGGLGPPKEEDLAWAYAYARNPFGLGSAAGRAIAAIELPLRFRFLGREFSVRIDALIIEPNGTLTAWEATASRQASGLADQAAVDTMAALDLLALDRSANLPAALRAPQRKHHCVVASLETWTEVDVSLPPEDIDVVMNDIDDLLERAQGEVEATPSRENCQQCPWQAECAYAWVEETAADA